MTGNGCETCRRSSPRGAERRFAVARGTVIDVDGLRSAQTRHASGGLGRLAGGVIEAVAHIVLATAHRKNPHGSAGAEAVLRRRRARRDLSSPLGRKPGRHQPGQRRNRLALADADIAGLIGDRGSGLDRLGEDVLREGGKQRMRMELACDIHIRVLRAAAAGNNDVKRCSGARQTDAARHFATGKAPRVKRSLSPAVRDQASPACSMIAGTQ